MRLTTPPAQSSLLTSVKYIFPSVSLQAPVLSVVVTHGIYLIPKRHEKNHLIFLAGETEPRLKHTLKNSNCMYHLL